MANPLEGFGISEFTNKLNVANFKNLNKLDEFVNSSDNPEVLKGGISKIEQLNDLELASDLKALQGTSTTQDVADKFSDLMNNYMNNVDQKHKAAEKAVETFASGGNIDVHSVMIAAEQANVSMQLTMQLRNKILQAYQEIHNIRI
ncbi:MAG: flagellar hook-basal body complex protein FliE [Candidatus Melainabacteria bacterium GWF2_37_15]|nr:MAG: flagellar hook-basal body complex protein FliE [Candidatus Melainabacteria bacterium GWF2_37_15]